MSQFEHLELPRTSIELPRRGRGGGGFGSRRSDRGSHGRQLLDQISGLTQRSKQKTSPFRLNPKLIFKIKLSPDGTLQESALSPLGLTLLAQEPKANKAIVVFTSDEQLTQFRSRLEAYIFFDGTLVYEWLVATQEGVDLYESLFASGKQCIGVMKNIKANVVFSTFARALRTGELFIIETLYDHLSNSNAPNRNQGESSRGTLSSFLNGAATRVLRGIFKPRNKVFGFEVHEDHLENMLRIMTADCQMNHAGHEIPFLLNRVDEEVRRNFNSRILQDRIALRMATQSEELFFEEMNERTFR